MSFFDRGVSGPDGGTGAPVDQGPGHETQAPAPPVVSPPAAHIRNAALPSMADIESLAASLDQIDQTLADLDQPRPTPLVP